MIVFGLSLLGCSTASSPPNSADSPKGTVISPEAMAILQGSAISPQDLAFLNLAQQELQQRCMAQQGFRFFGFNPTPPQVSDSYSQLNLAERREVGYGLYQAFEDQAAGNRGASSPGIEQSQYTQSLSQAQQQAYNLAMVGPPSDVRTFTGFQQEFGQSPIAYSSSGCLAEGTAEVYGSVPRNMEVISYPVDIASQFQDRLKADSAYQTALSAWSKCMANAGFDYQNSNQAISDLTNQYQQDGPTAALREKEIDVAVQDDLCASSTHLNTVLSVATSKYAAKLSSSEDALILQVGQWEQHAVNQAEKVINS
jgi:hypothetical protein